MSLAGKLISAAVAVGAAAAVGYGLKKLENKVQSTLQNPESNAPEKEVIGTANPHIRLKKSGANDWSYVVRNKGIIKESENSQTGDVRQFHFVPLKDGVTELEFDYKPKGADVSQRTITYNIEVKGGKIIRCDAAGDLEMIQKEKNE